MGSADLSLDRVEPFERWARSSPEPNPWDALSVASRVQKEDLRNKRSLRCKEQFEAQPKNLKL